MDVVKIFEYIRLMMHIDRITLITAYKMFPKNIESGICNTSPINHYIGLVYDSPVDKHDLQWIPTMDNGI